MANKKECDRCGHLGPVEPSEWGTVELNTDSGLGLRCDESDLCVGCVDSFLKWMREGKKTNG